MNNNQDVGLELVRRYKEFQADSGADKLIEFSAYLSVIPLLSPKHTLGRGLSVIATQNGEKFIPAFTSQAEFDKCDFPNSGTADMSFMALNGIVTDDTSLSGIVVNPFGELILLRREFLESILNTLTGMTVSRVNHSEKLVFGKATGISERLKTALAQGFAQKQEVYEVYILSAHTQSAKTSHLLILIDFDGDRKLLFPYVAELMRPHLKRGTQFELLKADYATLQEARKTVRPIYKANRNGG